MLTPETTSETDQRIREALRLVAGEMYEPAGDVTAALEWVYA